MTPIEQTLYEITTHLQAALPGTDPDTPVLEMLGRLTGQRDARIAECTRLAGQLELVDEAHYTAGAKNSDELLLFIKRATDAWAALPDSVGEPGAAPEGATLADRINALTQERDFAREGWNRCHSKHMGREPKTAEDWGTHDGLLSWLQSEAHTIWQRSDDAIPVKAIEAVAAMWQRKLHALTHALLRRRDTERLHRWDMIRQVLEHIDDIERHFDDELPSDVAAITYTNASGAVVEQTPEQLATKFCEGDRDGLAALIMAREQLRETYLRGASNWLASAPPDLDHALRTLLGITDEEKASTT